MKRRQEGGREEREPRARRGEERTANKSSNKNKGRNRERAGLETKLGVISRNLSVSHNPLGGEYDGESNFTVVVIIIIIIIAPVIIIRVIPAGGDGKADGVGR